MKARCFFSGYFGDRRYEGRFLNLSLDFQISPVKIQVMTHLVQHDHQINIKNIFLL